MAFVNCTYTGIQQVRRFHVTIGHGNTVVAVLDVLPQFGIPPANGTLFITDGLNNLTIPGCRIDRANITLTNRGHIVRVVVLGPTWKWRFGALDGRYNIKLPDGSVDPATEKSPQELATLCFEAMKVPLFDVSNLPNDPNDRPEIDWSCDSAWSELTFLCHERGCDFGLDTNGTVARIWQLGVGAQLPDGGRVQSIGYGVDIGEIPDVLRGCFGTTLYQNKFKLNAVMRDNDDARTLRDKDDVAYVPNDGWDGVDPDEPLADPNLPALDRQLAAEDYLRVWQIESLADGSLTVPDYGDVDGADKLLPVFPFLAADYTDPVTGDVRQRSFLEGTFAIKGEPVALQNTEDFTLVEVSFSIDREKGLVYTSVPIYKLDDEKLRVEADLYLVAAHYVLTDTGYDYHAIERLLGNNDTGARAVRRPDISKRVVTEWNEDSPGESTTNQVEIEAEMEAQLDAVQAEYQSVSSEVRRYIGIPPVVLDGAIRQITYFGSTDGGGKGFYTMVSRNTEWEPGIYRRLRRRQLAEEERRRAHRERDMHRKSVRDRKGEDER